MIGILVFNGLGAAVIALAPAALNDLTVSAGLPRGKVASPLNTAGSKIFGAATLAPVLNTAPLAS